jgi:methionyl-tRNA formyltransferase
MRIAFMGTPDFAVPTLDALIEAGHDIAAVYSQPPRPAGRGKALNPSPVDKRAEAAGIEVRTPVSLKGAEEQAAFVALGVDAAVVAAYGLILPEAILAAPWDGCLNVHASLLPRWRGAAPIQRAILAGDRRTGITIMQMERGLDTGPLMAAVATEIGRKSAGELTAELAAIGAKLMVEVFGAINRVGRVPQNDARATYAPKIEKQEARLDFGYNAVDLERKIRAFNPAPGAWFDHDGERIKILSAEVFPGGGEPGYVTDDMLTISCGNGVLLPTLVQRAGRAPMDPQDLLRGFPIPVGTILA